jgi:hypothetical protein
MPEWLQQLGPLGAIFSSLISSTVAVALTLLITHKRKAVLITVQQKASNKIKFRINEIDIETLNRAVIYVQNTGNAMIENLIITVVYKGQLSFIGYRRRTVTGLLKSLELTDDLAEKKANDTYAINPTTSVQLPFFNPSEYFTVMFFFDGDSNAIKVGCRVPDVRCKIIRGNTYRRPTGLMKSLGAFLGF